MNKHIQDVFADFRSIQTNTLEPDPHVLALMLIAEIRMLKDAINNIDNITVQVNK